MSGLRRKLRSRLVHRLDSAIGDSRILQWLLGFRKTHRGVIDKLGPVRLEYDPRTVIGNQLFLAGAFEESEFRFFQEILAAISQPVVLDVGANIGVHTIGWARACRRARIYAFEPSRSTFELLRANVDRNNVGANVEMIPEAVSDQVGVGEFFSCEDDAYSSLRDTERKRVLESFPVTITTIDTFADSRKLSKIDLIKIDVEGFERQALEGAQRTLRKLRPHLFVEIFGGKNSNPDPAGTVDFVRSLGYEAFVLRNGIPEPYRQHSDALFNYYFRPLR
jgi:FkbM family methyltransferase